MRWLDTMAKATIGSTNLLMWRLCMLDVEERLIDGEISLLFLSSIFIFC
jgi:hypothetical protein